MIYKTNEEISDWFYTNRDKPENENIKGMSVEKFIISVRITETLMEWVPKHRDIFCKEIYGLDIYAELSTFANLIFEKINKESAL